MATFVPHKPEEVITARITKREALLIQELRKHTFGKITVHKASGILVRVEVLNSQLLEEEAPITISTE